MADERMIAGVLRSTSKVVRESKKIRARASETLSVSSSIIDRSRKLLSMWPVSGIPALPRVLCAEPAGAPPASATVRGRAVLPVSDQPPLERITEQRFSKEIVRLDGRHFVDCTIDNCTLDYSGGPVVLEGTQFSGCRFHFGGEAAMTVSVLECFSLIGQEEAAPLRSGNSARVN